MDMDLRTVPARVISIPRQKRRRRHIAQHFGDLGISFQFIDGIKADRKTRGVAEAHLNAFESAGAPPFMVFEDDVEFAGESLVLRDIPADADIVYLGKNADGCLPYDPEYAERFGHRSLTDLALASVHDADWLRLHSMVSAHAILFLTERATRMCMEEQRIARNRATPLDVRYAYLMSVLNVYAPHRPLFVEALDLQPDEKVSERRLHITHGPFPTARVGDIRTTQNRNESITVQVVEAEDGRLEWDVVDI